MAFDINFENNYRGVLFQAYGHLTGEDFLEISNTVYNFDQSRKVEYQIMDLTEVEEVDVELSDLESLAALDSDAGARKPGMKIAVVVPPGKIEELTYVWAELCEGSGLEIQVCRDMTTARSWISQSVLEAFT